MFGIPNVFEYLSGGLALLLLGTGIYNKIEVSGLETTVAESQLELSDCKTQARLYKVSLDEQTSLIELTRVDYEQSLLELEEWRTKPATVRYETIYKYIPEIEYVKGDCNDTKILIDSIGNIDYNNL